MNHSLFDQNSHLIMYKLNPSRSKDKKHKVCIPVYRAPSGRMRAKARGRDWFTRQSAYDLYPRYQPCIYSIPASIPPSFIAKVFFHLSTSREMYFCRNSQNDHGNFLNISTFSPVVRYILSNLFYLCSRPLVVCFKSTSNPNGGLQKVTSDLVIDYLSAVRSNRQY